MNDINKRMFGTWFSREHSIILFIYQTGIVSLVMHEKPYPIHTWSMEGTQCRIGDFVVLDFDETHLELGTINGLLNPASYSLKRFLA